MSSLPQFFYRHIEPFSSLPRQALIFISKSGLYGDNPHASAYPSSLQMTLNARARQYSTSIHHRISTHLIVVFLLHSTLNPRFLTPSHHKNHHNGPRSQIRRASLLRRRLSQSNPHPRTLSVTFPPSSLPSLLTTPSQSSTTSAPYAHLTLPNPQHLNPTSLTNPPTHHQLTSPTVLRKNVPHPHLLRPPAPATKIPR